jgi:hypothetical protein
MVRADDGYRSSRYYDEPIRLSPSDQNEYQRKNSSEGDEMSIDKEEDNTHRIRHVWPILLASKFERCRVKELLVHRNLCFIYSHT